MKITKYMDKISADNLLFFFIAATFACFPLGTAAPLISIACAFAVFLFSGKFLTCRVYKKRWFITALIFVTLPWIGLLYSKNLDLGIDYALKTKYWIAVFLTAAIVFNRKNMKMIIIAFWASLLASSVVAFFQYIEILPIPESSFLGFGTVYTVLSMYLIIGIMMASYYYRNCTRTVEKIMMILLMVAFFFHLAVLNGRNGYLVLFLVSPLIVHNLTSKLSISIKLVTFLMLIGMLALSPVVQQRTKMTLDHLKRTDVIMEGKFDPLFPRPFMFHQTFKMIAQSPIIGIGTGSLKYYTQETGHVVNHPHNSMLYMQVSFGILGTLSFFWLFGTMFWISYKNKDTPSGFFAFSICMVIFLGGFFDTLIINAGTSLLLPMGYGILNHLDA
ncbi:MAG: hypothetical protein KKE62_00710 [Proteobacteria bacterium]|nr:hypothetical protein [Pseudomonadota bacterium]MBU1389521.1 hypothetical protein [Pseudomonadota bacterium]MBU1541341.1 hypothetical protein [Pseudomonadota bacterium]MBU2482918.1 hypothetical protein [Pseudomonadota bacterium]